MKHRQKRQQPVESQTLDALIEEIDAEHGRAETRFNRECGVRADWLADLNDQAASYAGDGFCAGHLDESRFKRELDRLLRQLRYAERKFFKDAVQANKLDQRFRSKGILEVDLVNRWKKHLRVCDALAAQPEFDLDRASELYLLALELMEELQSEQRRIKAARARKAAERQRAEAERQREARMALLERRRIHEQALFENKRRDGVAQSIADKRERQYAANEKVAKLRSRFGPDKTGETPPGIQDRARDLSVQLGIVSDPDSNGETIN